MWYEVTTVIKRSKGMAQVHSWLGGFRSCHCRLRRRQRRCPSSLLFGVGANVGAAGFGLPPSKKSHEWNSTPPRSLCRSVLSLPPSLQVTRSVFFKCYVLLLRMDGAEERDTWPFEMVLTKDIVDLKRYLLLLSWVVGAWDQIRLGAKAKHPLAELLRNFSLSGM